MLVKQNIGITEPDVGVARVWYYRTALTVSCEGLLPGVSSSVNPPHSVSLLHSAVYVQ